jgi:hypothetical protein
LIQQETVTSFPTHFRKKRGNGWGILTALERFSNCCTPEPMLPSGFFLKKKPPSVMPVRVHVLESRSNRRINNNLRKNVPTHAARAAEGLAA